MSIFYIIPQNGDGKGTLICSSCKAMTSESYIVVQTLAMQGTEISDDVT